MIAIRVGPMNFGEERHHRYSRDDDSNPFLSFLQGLTKESDTTVSWLRRNSIEYRVCGTEATTLAQGEEPGEPEEPEEPAAELRIPVEDLIG
jgi:hypothetical protein